MLGAAVFAVMFAFVFVNRLHDSEHIRCDGGRGHEGSDSSLPFVPILLLLPRLPLSTQPSQPLRRRPIRPQRIDARVQIPGSIELQAPERAVKVAGEAGQARSGAVHAARVEGEEAELFGGGGVEDAAHAGGDSKEEIDPRAARAARVEEDSAAVGTTISRGIVGIRAGGVVVVVKFGGGRQADDGEGDGLLCGGGSGVEVVEGEDESGTFEIGVAGGVIKGGGGGDGGPVELFWRVGRRRRECWCQWGVEGGPHERD